MAEVPNASLLDSLLFGSLVSAVLLGIMTTMAWRYLVSNHDGWRLQSLVYVSVVLAYAAAGSKAAMGHHFLVHSFGDSSALSKSYIMTNVMFFLSGLIFFLVHTFFATRLWLLTSNRWIPSVIGVLSTVMLTFSAYTAFGSNQHIVETGTVIFHILALTTDLIVTSSFTYYFAKSTSNAFSKGTIKAIHRLVHFIVTRGIALTLLQIPHVVMYIKWKNDALLWLSLHLLLDPLDVITMLAMLNSRRTTKAMMQDENGAVIDMDELGIRFTTTSHHPDDIEGGTNPSRLQRMEDTTTSRSSISETLPAQTPRCSRFCSDLQLSKPT